MASETWWRYISKGCRLPLYLQRTHKCPSNCSFLMKSPIFFTFFIISLFFSLQMWTLIGWTFTLPNSCISKPVSQSFPNFYTLKTPKLTQIWSLINHFFLQSVSTDKIRLDPWQKQSKSLSVMCNLQMWFNSPHRGEQFILFYTQWIAECLYVIS